MYLDHFKFADDFIEYLRTASSSTGSPLILSRQVGFVAVSAVTVYELAIKDIFCEFGAKKHKVLGAFAKSHFDRLNGRIKYRILWEEYASRFGEKYSIRLRKEVERSKRAHLRSDGKDIVTCYNNLIEWRNLFAHEGQIPPATLLEVMDSYKLGKEVIKCLDAAMTR